MATTKKKLSAADKKKIQDQIAELQSALEDQADGEPGAEEEVDEESEKLAALFDRLNLTEEDYDLIVAAIGTGVEGNVRNIVREELDAREKDDDSLAALQDDPDAPEVKDEDDSPTNDDDSEAPGKDETPKSEHWTDRKIFGRKDKHPETDEA